MKSWLKYLLQPLNYLAIRYEKGTRSKLFLDFIAPILTACILYLFSYLINKKLPDLTTVTIDKILSFLTLAFPFYVASLTAVSTFPSAELDKKLEGDKNKQATLKKWNNDEQRDKPEILSRRRFIAYMFGYLSLVSLMMIVLVVFDRGFNISNFVYILPEKISFILIHLANFLFWTLLLNIIFVTLMALRFLTYSVTKSHIRK